MAAGEVCRRSVLGEHLPAREPCKSEGVGSAAALSIEERIIEVLHVLFVCSRNRWRSPTAEKIYSKHGTLCVRSRGTSSKAVRTVSAKDLKWADVILVMEPKHRQQLQSRFPGELRDTECHVLNIPDDYRYMDPELQEMIRISVDPLLENWDT